MSDDDATRVLFEMSYYSDNKNAIKKPFKDLDLKWQFLGQEKGSTKGRYAGDDISVFVLFTSEHADFTLQGDAKKKQTILDAWDDHPTTQPTQDDAPPTPAEEQRTKEVRMWEFKKPTQRPGEPDALYQRRLKAWEKEDPRE